MDWPLPEVPACACFSSPRFRNGEESFEKCGRREFASPLSQPNLQRPTGRRGRRRLDQYHFNRRQAGPCEQPLWARGCRGAVDAEGEVLDVLVQSTRNKHAALKLMRKLLKKYAFAPERLVIGLRSYAPAARALGIEHLHERGRWKNHRPRIRISRPDGGSARCGAPRAPALRRNSSQPTPPCTTLSTSNAISRLLNHTACSAAAASAVGARDAPRADDDPERVAESYGPNAERLIKARQS